MRFNDWLAEKKRAFGMNNKQIAEACGVSESAVGHWLKGNRMPERAAVARLALLFKVSPTTIMRMTDSEALEEEVLNEQGQQSMAELLAYVPELGEFMGILRGLSVEDRATVILLARRLRGSTK